MTKNETLNKGDYVLATKWHDGDSQDPWYVGFFEEIYNERYYVVDSDGNNVRPGGFRRCEKISSDIGRHLVENSEEITLNSVHLWDYINSRAF